MNLANTMLLNRFYPVSCVRRRKHSMQKVILHDGLAAGVLNLDYTGGKGQFGIWKAELQNSEDVLRLVSQRITSDFENTAAKMRKPLNLKDLESWIDM